MNNSKNTEYVVEIPKIDTQNLLDDVNLFTPVAELGNGVAIRYSFDVSINVSLQRVGAFLRILERFGSDDEGDYFVEDVSAMLTSLELQIQAIKRAVDA